MKHIRIKNFGPIKEADLTFGKVNVIIGMQSSGKSCVLKIACYCVWVEKRLELTRKVNDFGNGSTFIDMMLKYYNMPGYLKDETYIEYETNHLKFKYDNLSQSFDLVWKNERWNYKRPKVSYIPADRNIVAVIPSWSALPLDEYMIDFMADWDKARKSVSREDNFLGLGLSYIYDSMVNSDRIELEDGRPLMLKESSSGIQSLLPMYVHLDYLMGGLYHDAGEKISYEQKEERKNLLSTIYSNLYDETSQGTCSEIVTIDGFDYHFKEYRDAEKFKALYKKYINTDHSEIFLEEPEDNLFPPTQCNFINWLLDSIQKHDDTLFIATHSPYVLNQVIKINPKKLNIFFTYPSGDEKTLYSVRQLKESEVHEIYDNGVDMFFNFELYV